MKKNIHVGTSGWSYKHWKKIFYPECLAPVEYLAYYAKEFKTTEINTSFYHLPKPKTIRDWKKLVPGDFLFCPKISRFITHMKKLNDPAEILPVFFNTFKNMKRHMGPVLIQLPPNLGFHKDKADSFFSYLKLHYKGYHFALEARHGTWFSPDASALLTKYDIASVIAESGKRFPYSEQITSENIYIRFHGPDGSYATSYPTKTLQEYAEKCLHWHSRGHTIWAFFNNDVNGYAIANARDFIAMLY